MLGEGEGGHDEAVGVDDVGRDGPVVGGALHHAGDLAAVAHPFQAGDQEAAAQEQDDGGPEKLG